MAAPRAPRPGFRSMLLIPVLVLAGCGDPQPSAAFVVASSDGVAELALPEGALPEGVRPEDIQVVVNEGVTADEDTEVRFAYRLLPDGLVLNEPAVFSMPNPFLPDETSFVRHDSAAQAEMPEFDLERAFAGELALSLSHFSDLTGLVDQRALTAETAIRDLQVDGPPDPIVVGQSTTIRVRVTFRSSGSVPDFAEAKGGVPSQLVWNIGGGPVRTFVTTVGRKAMLEPSGGRPGTASNTKTYTSEGTTAEYEVSLTCSEAGMYEAQIQIRFDWDGESVQPDGTRKTARIRGTRILKFSGTCLNAPLLECPGIAAPECRSTDFCPTGKLCDDDTCACVCSRIHGAQCEGVGDCAEGQLCNNDCSCECSVWGGGCEADTDCSAGSTCDLETCQCSEPPACETGDMRLGSYFNLNTLLFANAAAFCGALHLLRIIRLLHSALGIPERPVAHDHTTILAWAIYLYTLSQLQVDALFNNSVFECGEGPDGYTLCSDMRNSAVPPGDFVVLASVVEEDIPLADPTNHYQYGFVFDADGVTTNNYQPAAAYPNDFFKDTDRWYQANYQPTTGWSLTANTAINGVVTEVPTDARVIIRGNVILLIAPATEFGVSMPSFRVTSFRHTGDYGIPEPHDYDGSVWPAVADGLQIFP